MLRVITKHSLMPRSSREKQNQPWPGKNIMFNAKVYGLKENPALGNCLFHDYHGFSELNHSAIVVRNDGGLRWESDEEI